MPLNAATHIVSTTIAKRKARTVVMDIVIRLKPASHAHMIVAAAQQTVSLPKTCLQSLSAILRISIIRMKVTS